MDKLEKMELFSLEQKTLKTNLIFKTTKGTNRVDSEKQFSLAGQTKISEALNEDD